MGKIYKIYFDGDKVTAENMRVIHNQGFHYYNIYDASNKLDGHIQYSDVDRVLEWSACNIKVYTFDEDKISILSKLVGASVRDYHEKQISIKKKEIEGHEEILYKLHFQMEYE